MSDKEKEITIFSGRHIWKSGAEYYNESMYLHGFPYYQITEIDEVCYLWELDLDEADHGTYRIMKTSTDFKALWDEGMKLDRAIGDKYEELHLFSKLGKEIIEKLKSAR